MSRPLLLFPHPEPSRVRPRIHPVFLPFAGCPHRCLFCDQPSQTGVGVRPLAVIHDELAAMLSRLFLTHAPPREIGFYGGTFTSLPAPWPKRFLELATQYKDKGLITKVRCSTRPDAVTSRGLEQLKGLGLDMVELGIQSFNDEALAQSGRGYTGRTAHWGCTIVRQAGLKLAIQLLPGLPGDAPGTFARDIEITTKIKPDAARLYPCMVLDGTPLAETWKSGDYTPWSLERTRQELAVGLGALWRAGIQVIRIGLAPEPGLDKRILAGPHHPSLGQMVRSLALFDHILLMAAGLGRTPVELRYPERYSGEISGHNAELEPAFARLGIELRTSWKYGQFLLR
ncbi:MAG: radical SAM protein [Proteobacteria bacterium]|nr:radical SAM protein [Pseudomonadota bacterium]MBU1610366.1 radical SAM protein [Pseudomonadota bacterium]